MSRLVIALDVDGVLAPWGQPSKKAAGYRRVDTHPAGTQWAHPRRPLQVWLHPSHGALLLGLAADLTAELVWLTSWNHHANDWIAPAIGLPPLPVINVAPPAGVRPATQHWKRPAVAEWAAGRPLAWLDDEFQADDARWAADRTAARQRTLLVNVNEHHGFCAMHAAFVRSWARQRRSSGKPTA
jgi:HAD domain in Swiss Army Knife RNA repair proteins